MSTASPALRVLVVDDSPAVRDLLRQVLAANGIAVVGEADHREAALDLIDEIECDVVTMNMPGMGGIERARRSARASRLPRGALGEPARPSRADLQHQHAAV
ncbi:response regulator [Baekduia alba]|uniref:response regulator n=1 Tax=Baekduia alba TaxID=2997333 RepID=UPI003D78D5E1